jgi:AcrR family transcriptional regulator
VTSGAFYHYFASKQALAMAMVDQGWSTVIAEVTRCLNRSGPGLERVITMTFQLSELMKRDKSVGMANHLAQAFGQLSLVEGRQSLHEHVGHFIHRVADALSDIDFRDDVSPTQAASLVWIALHGCHLISDAAVDDSSHIEQLHVSWKVWLRSLLTPAALAHYEQFTTDLADRYTDSDRHRAWPG